MIQDKPKLEEPKSESEQSEQGIAIKPPVNYPRPFLPDIENFKKYGKLKPIPNNNDSKSNNESKDLWKLIIVRREIMFPSEEEESDWRESSDSD